MNNSIRLPQNLQECHYEKQEMLRELYQIAAKCDDIEHELIFHSLNKFISEFFLKEEEE